MQPRLILEDITDALVELVHATGGWKEAGYVLRPDLAPDRAGEWLRAALDPERREALQPSQLMVLLRRGREKGSHVVIDWLLATLSYAPTSPVSRDDEALLLRRDIAAGVERLNKAMARLEQLEASR